MKFIEKWLGTLTGVGVILGLAFVAVELRQNTQEMQSQTRSEIASMIVDLVEQEREPRLVEANLRRLAGEELTPEDLYLLRSMANAHFRVWENNYYQYSRGLFDEAEFQADLSVWGLLMREPIRRDLWQQTRALYSPRLQRVVDSIHAAVAPLEEPSRPAP